MKNTLTTRHAVILWILLVIIILVSGCTNPLTPERDNVPNRAPEPCRYEMAEEWIYFGSDSALVMVSKPVYDDCAELKEFQPF